MYRAYRETCLMRAACAATNVCSMNLSRMEQWLEGFRARWWPCTPHIHPEMHELVILTDGMS